MVVEAISENVEKYFFRELMSLPYSQIISFNKFIQENTPYATKHGVKGAEFHNVLVVIDDSAWNLYKFSDVFAGRNKDTERFKRTLNLLYVCCSRAKNNLTLLALTPIEAQALSNLEGWFGQDNILSIENLT